MKLQGNMDTGDTLENSETREFFNSSGPTREELKREVLQNTGEDGMQWDDLRFNFGTTTKKKLLSREDEVALAREVIRLRVAWRKSVLRSSYGRQQAFAVYENAEQMDAPQILRTFQTDAETPKAFMTDLQRLLPELRLLMQQGTTDDIVTLMEQCKLSDAKIREIMHDAEGKDPAPETENIRQSFAVWKALRDELFLSNKRLVVYIAKRYRNRGLPLSDLIQEGSIGLLRALDKYDPELGCKLSTYATWWIRQGIQRGLANSARTIRIPVNQINGLTQIRNFMEQYVQENACAPSMETIAVAVGLSVNTVSSILNANRFSGSLEDGANEQKDNLLQEFLADEKSPSPFLDACADERRLAIVEALRSLTRREREMIILRFGLGLQELPPAEGDVCTQFIVDEEHYGKSLTLLEIANRLGVTWWRIRQVMDGALRKLANADHPLRYLIAMHKEGCGPEPEKVESLASSNGDARLQLGLAEIGVSLRVVNALEAQGIYTVGDYRSLNDSEKQNIWQIGEGSLKALDDAMEALFA